MVLVNAFKSHVVSIVNITTNENGTTLAQSIKENGSFKYI
jgi:hypothetical protein